MAIFVCVIIRTFQLVFLQPEQCFLSQQISRNIVSTCFFFSKANRAMFTSITGTPLLPTKGLFGRSIHLNPLSSQLLVRSKKLEFFYFIYYTLRQLDWIPDQAATTLSVSPPNPLLKFKQKMIELEPKPIANKQPHVTHS